MPGGSDFKVATVDVESGDNMATLPVSRAHTGSSGTDTAEKNNATNKEMELKNVMPKPLQRYPIDIHHFRVYHTNENNNRPKNHWFEWRKTTTCERRRAKCNRHTSWRKTLNFFLCGSAFCAHFCWHILIAFFFTNTTTNQANNHANYTHSI